MFFDNTFAHQATMIEGSSGFTELAAFLGTVNHAVSRVTFFLCLSSSLLLSPFSSLFTMRPPYHSALPDHHHLESGFTEPHRSPGQWAPKGLLVGCGPGLKSELQAWPRGVHCSVIPSQLLGPCLWARETKGNCSSRTNGQRNSPNPIKTSLEGSAGKDL